MLKSLSALALGGLAVGGLAPSDLTHGANLAVDGLGIGPAFGPEVSIDDPAEAAPPDEDGEAEPDHGALLYPAERAETRVHFFALDDEPDMKRTRDALTKVDDTADIVFGPSNTTAKPKDFFVAVQAPADVESKDLAKALKKGKVKVDEVEWMMTSFTPPDMSKVPGGRSGGGGNAEALARKVVLDSHGDMRWFELVGNHAIFFWAEGKLDGEEILERTRTALKGYVPEKDLPVATRDTFTWSLAGEFKESGLKKAVKNISKLSGVVDVVGDFELSSLTVTVDLIDRAASAEPGPWPGDEPEKKDDDAGGGGRGGGAPPVDPDPGAGGGAGGGGGGRAGGGGGGGGDWFAAHRLTFDRNAAIDLLEKQKIFLVEHGDDGSDAGR